MKKFVLLISFLLTGFGVWAQSSKPVLGAPSSRQSGIDIVVDYSIQMEPGVSCDIALYLSCDGGRHFSRTPLKQVTGDVGRIEQSGQKSIIWHVLDEEDALTGDNLAFKVNVEWVGYRPDSIQYGSVMVSSSPTDATIWIDGINTKKTTPEVFDDLEPGKHTVKLVKEGYYDRSVVLAIKSGSQSDLSLTLWEKVSRAPIAKRDSVEKPDRAKKVFQVNEKPTAVVSTATGSTSGHGWVDLGLSVKWATCNVGASEPSDYGFYFAWAETSEKGVYGFHNLRYYTAGTGNTPATISKYNPDSRYGEVDNKPQLDASDDAANANWGGSWRMPSNSEIMELIEKCTWTWTTLDGKKGYEVKSKTNGNSIFLPAAGYRDEGDFITVGLHGYYWSASLYTYIPDYSWLMYFSMSDYDGYYSNRRYGFSVRPVID